MKIAKTAIKIIGYLLAGLLGLVVILAISVNFLLRSPSFTGFVLSKVLPSVEESLGARIAVEKLTLSLLPFRLRVGGVTFTPAEGEFRQNFAELDRLELDVAFRPLLRGEVVVDRLLIEGVRVYLFIDEEGLANLPIKSSGEEEQEEQAEAEGPPEIKLPIRVNDLRIRGLSVSLDIDRDPETPGLDMEVTLPSIALDARADLSTGDTHAELRVVGGSFKAGDLQDVLERLDLDVDFSLAQWGGRITKLEIRLPQVELDLTARVEDVLTDLRLAADLEGRIDIAKVNDLFISEPKLVGALDLKVHAEAELPKFSVDGEIRMEEARVNDLGLRDFKLAFSATQSEAKITEFFTRVAGGHIRVEAKVGLEDPMPLFASVDLDQLDIKKAMKNYGLGDLGLAAILGGNIRAEGRLGGEEMRVSSQVNLALTQVAYGDIIRIPAVGVDIKSTYKPSGLDLDHAIITTKRTRIQADGRVALPSMGLGLNFLVKAEDLGEFSPVAGREVAGSILIKGRVKGKASSPDLDLTLAADNLRHGKLGVDEIRAHILMAAKTLRVEKLFVRNKAAVVTLAAKVELAGKTPVVEVDLNIPPASLTDFLDLAGLSDLDLKGDLALKVNIHGPVDRLSGTTDLLISDVSAYGEEIKSLHLGVELEDGLVQLRDLSLVKLAPPRPDYTRRADKIRVAPREEWQEVGFRATGSFEPESGRISLSLASLSLNEQSSDILRGKALPLVADIGFRGEFGGTVENPEGEFELSLLNARFQDMVLGDSRIGVKLADNRISVTGRFLTRREEVEIQTPAPVVTGGWTVHRFNSKETVKSDGGDREAPPSGDATAWIDEEDAEFQDAELPAEKTSPPLGSINLDLALELEGEQALEGRIVFDHFDYSGFLGSLRKTKMPHAKGKGEESEDADLVEGLLDGEVRFAGSLKQIEDIRGEVNIATLYFRKNDLIIRNQAEGGGVLPLRLSYQGGRLEVESFRLGGEGVGLSLAREGSLFRLLLAADMAVAQQFVSVLTEAKGKLIVDASIPDDFDMAGARAVIRIDDAAFTVQGVPTPLENLNVLVNYADGALSLDRMEAVIGGGTLEGGGKIFLPTEEDDILKMDVHLKLAGVKTGLDPFLEIVIDKVDIYVNTIEKGEHRGKLDVGGEVVIGKALFTQNFDILTIFNSFADLGKQKAAGGKETYEEKEESIFFNIALRADEDVGFRSNVAEIETGMDLVLVGSNITPGLKGTVRVLKGWATVPPNTYDLSNATIQFYDEQRIFPSFDINANTEVKGTKVFVNVAGNPIRYKMTLNSDPPKSQRDIFFLLTTGTSYEDFQAEGSGLGDEAAGVAAQALVGEQLGQLAGGVSGLDVGIDSSSGTSRLKMGSEVEKDLYMSVHRGLVDQSLGAEVEYGFYRYVAGIGSWDNMAGYDDVQAVGAFGAGLRLKIDFQ